MNTNEKEIQAVVRPNRLPDGRLVTKTHATRSISGLKTPYPRDPECGCRLVPDGFEPRSIYVEFRVGRNRKTRSRQLWKVSEQSSVEAVEAWCLVVAHADRKANWVGWQVIAREDETVVQLNDRVIYCQKLPPRCRCCGEYEFPEVAPGVERSEPRRRCCISPSCGESMSVTKEMWDSYGLWFDPPMVMASPPVSDTVVLPHVEPANGTENDSVESPAGDASFITI